MGMRKHSGLQKQVLKLYRDLLRTCEQKPDPKKFKSIVRSDFKQNAKLGKMDIGAIEYLIRKGEKWKGMLEDKNLLDITVR